MDATAELVELLGLEQIDTDLYRGTQPVTVRQRVFGGQVAAQALMAGIRSADPEYVVHSLHSYFLLPGDYSVPIVYDVENLRDGRSFLTRRVVARQHGRPIYYQTLNFQRPEEGYEHQDAMPDVPAPDDGMDLVSVMRTAGNDEADALGREWNALDVRWLGNSMHNLEPDPSHPSRSRLWVRLRGRLPDDPHVHAAAFTFASDASLLGAAMAIHVTDPSHVQVASLDHSIWFHRPFRADEWWLYDQWSPSAQGAIGLAIGRVFSQDGALVATVTQEGLMRPRTDGFEGPGIKEQ